MPLADVFQVERYSDTFILTPTVSLSEVEYNEAVMQEVYAFLPMTRSKT